jgi:hypothetical protein
MRLMGGQTQLVIYYLNEPTMFSIADAKPQPCF